ncbi:hypothetical protein L9F63_015620, partial [Diploptera punctata]
ITDMKRRDVLLASTATVVVVAAAGKTERGGLSRQNEHPVAKPSVYTCWQRCTLFVYVSQRASARHPSPLSDGGRNKIDKIRVFLPKTIMLRFRTEYFD